MKYTKYFGGIIKHNGIPNLSQESFQTMMNIVWLEGQLEGLLKAQKNIRQEEEKYRFDIIKFNVGKQLTELTGNREPKDIMNDLVKQLN